MSLLEIKDLAFSWAGSAPPFLRIKDFQIREGEKLFIKGSSGSGKSTLLHLFSGILRPQQGQILFNDQDLCKLSNSELDKIRGTQMGFIFQNFNLFPYLNLIENVLLPLELHPSRRQAIQENSPKEEAFKLLSRLGLSADKPDIQTVESLSVGQQQRVACARALIGSPSLIMADEPTSALDHDNRQAFLEMLFEECSRCQSALLFVSHDHSLEPLFDRSVSISEFHNGENS